MRTSFVLSRTALLLAVALLVTSADAASCEASGSDLAAPNCPGRLQAKLKGQAHALKCRLLKTKAPPPSASFPTAHQLLLARDYLAARSGVTEFNPVAASALGFRERFGTHSFFKDQLGSIYHYDPAAAGKGRMGHMHRAWALDDSLKAYEASADKLPETSYILKRVDVNKQEARHGVPFTNELLALAALDRLVLPAGLSPTASATDGPVMETVLLLAGSDDRGVHRDRAGTCASFNRESCGARCPAGTSAYFLQKRIPGTSFDHGPSAGIMAEDVASAVADRLDPLHNSGWIHPDMRAGNVMVDYNFRGESWNTVTANLIDFSSIQRIDSSNGRAVDDETRQQDISSAYKLMRSSSCLTV